MNKILDRNKYFSVQKKLYGIPLSSVPVYDYYVSKIGNDTSGDGSRLNPWQTLTKALITIAIGGGKTIGVGDGVYAEATRLDCARAFTSQVTISAISKNSNRVTIIGTNAGSLGNVIFQSNARNYKFEYFTFTARLNTEACSIRISSSTDITFYRCKIFVNKKSAQTNSGVFARPTTNGTINNILFQECQLAESGIGVGYGLNFDLGGVGSTINNVQIINCSGSMTQDNILVNGGTNYLIDGGSYQSLSDHTISISTDGVTSYTTTGIVRNATIINIAGHSLLMGRGCISGAIARNNTIVGGDYALVIKMCANVLAELNTITAGYNGGIYVKAATGAIVQDNVVTGVIAGTKILRFWSDDAGTQFGTLTCRRNTISGSGVNTKLIEWGGDTEDSGGGINDYNTYTPALSATLGAIRGASVTTLSAMQAAWSGYGDGLNDSYSIVN